MIGRLMIVLLFMEMFRQRKGVIYVRRYVTRKSPDIVFEKKILTNYFRNEYSITPYAEIKKKYLSTNHFLNEYSITHYQHTS